MAYNKEKLYKQAIEAAENEHVYFIEDVVSLIPCSKPTFYDLFPIDSNEINSIKDILESNKINMKMKLRDKLGKGEKAAEVLALYKLIATDSERKALSMTHIDHTTKDKPITGIELIDV